MSRAALLDVDGTLDTNYQHALAWYRAFRQSGIILPLCRIHRHVGMGGDQLVPAVAGEEIERDRSGSFARQAPRKCRIRRRAAPMPGRDAAAIRVAVGPVVLGVKRRLKLIGVSVALAAAALLLAALLAACGSSYGGGGGGSKTPSGTTSTNKGY